jgi:hypothetical protein
MNSPKTVSANWNTEYLVTYTVAGNVLPIDAPPNEWVISGATAQGKFVQTIVNLANDTQCLFQNDDRPTMITKPITVTGSYESQYKVTFSQIGVESDAIGTIAEILGQPKSYSQLPTSIWANSSSTVDFIFNSTVASTTANKAYTLLGSNATSPLIIDQPTVIQGNYQAESSVSLYTILEVAIVLFAALATTFLLWRYRRDRIRRQRNLTVAANPNR